MKLPEGYMRQHTLWERRTFNTQPLSRRWRQHHGMILPMPKTDENELHRQMEGLPRPSDMLAQAALKHLDRMPDDFGRMQRFLGVKALMWEIARDASGSDFGGEARFYANHFEDQNQFYGRVLTADEERELLGLPVINLIAV